MNPFIKVPTKAGYVLVNALQITSVFVNQNEDHASVKILYEVNAIRSTATLAEMEHLLGLGGLFATEDKMEGETVEEPGSGRKRKR